MPQSSVRIRDFVYTIVTARTKPWTWLTPTTIIVLAAVTFLAGAFGQEHDTKAAWAWIVAGVCSALCVGSFPLLRERAAVADRQVDLAEATRLRVTLRDALQPMSERISLMATKTRSQRQHEVGAVAQDAVSALILVLRDVERLRAVVYELNDDASRMEPIEYGGRGGQHPSEFVAGTVRGDDAIKLVQQNDSIVVEDVEALPSSSASSARSYRAYISVSINDGVNAYGMLRVDAPEAGSLTRLDQHLLEVVSNLLAIAYAIARS